MWHVWLEAAHALGNLEPFLEKWRTARSAQRFSKSYMADGLKEEGQVFAIFWGRKTAVFCYKRAKFFLIL
jgi:hypothetical protein